ncbi:MAG: hypothetical protein ABIP44_10985 [Pseudoxanthomonas sp.]
MSRPWLRVALLACLSFTGVGAAAQDVPASEEGPTLFGVELQPTDDFPNGKAQYLQARANPTGQQYKVDDIGLDQPILVSVLTRDPADVVRVRLTKISFDEPDRDAMTTGATRLDFGFRTFDGFKIWVTADKPTEYQLIVWAGDPIVEALPPLAIPASKYVEPTAASGSPAAATGNPAAGGITFSRLELALGGMLLLLIVGVLAFFIRRKPSAGVSP